MHLLILGYSSIVRRRVLPAARSVGAFDQISIASRSHQERRQGAPEDSGARASEAGVTWYSDYDAALAESRAHVVYVSGINSVHQQWMTRALERGCHVIVDKPALPDPRATETMLALARKQRVGVAEATVFTFHSQVAALKGLIAGADRRSIRVTAVFSVPPLPAGDFRYRADCDGGSLSDLGPYAVAVNRVIFDAAPATVSCRVLTRAADGVDTSFSVLMTHESGGSVAGHFGFVTAYQNRLSVLTAACSIDVDRIYTSAPDAPATLRVRDASGEQLLSSPAADAFAEFLAAFARATERGDFVAFESAMLADAELLARLRRAAR